MKRFLVLLGFVFFHLNVFGQWDSFPPFDPPQEPTEFGKCFAKCKVPDCKVELEKTVVTKESSKELIEIPAVYDTVTEQVLVKEASTEIITTPPVYETVTERVLVSPSYGKWVRKLRDPNCLANQGKDCYVMCYEEVPAEYKNMTKKVLKEPARTEERAIPAEYKTIKKTVLVSPASVQEVAIPAEYKTYNYDQIADRGGYTSWVEVTCDSNNQSPMSSNSMIRQLQQKLSDKGYSPGPIDGVMGTRTRGALTQFQKYMGMPISMVATNDLLKALEIK